MEWMKRIFLLLLISFLPGCTVLGTYMDPNDPAPSYRINGHLVKIRFVQVDPTWVLEHSKPRVYRVGPYDTLNVIVWDHPELTTITTQLSGPGESGFLVSAHGNIVYPFAGTLKVAGLTLPQIQTLIQQHISNYIRNPQVTVRVANFRSQQVQMMGEVAVNIIPLTDKPVSLLNALNASGGTNVMSSDTARIYVIRGDVNRLTVLAFNAKSPAMMIAAEHFYLQNNDIVYVPAIGLVNWDRFLAQIVNFGSSVQATHDLVKSAVD